MNKKNLFIIIGLLIIVLFLFLPFLKRYNLTIEDTDWLLHASFNYIVRDSIIHYKQFPFWTPFLGGGFPIFSYPIFTALHPFIFNTLLFGETVGMKLDILYFLFISAISMFYLTHKILKYNYPGAFFSVFLILFNPWPYIYVLDGEYLELWFLVFPLIFYFFLKSSNNYKYRIVTAGILSLMLLVTRWNYIGFFFFLIMYILVDLVLDKKRGRFFLELKNFSIIIALSLLYAMVKLLPVLELALIDARIKGPKIFLLPSFEKFIYFFRFLFLNLGFMQIVFCIGSFILARKETLKWLILLCFFTLMTLDEDSPLHITALLSHFPIFISMDSFDKYFDFFLVFIPALISGKFITLFSQKLKGGIKYFLLVELFILTFSPMYYKCDKLKSTMFTFDVPEFHREKDFFQIQGINLPRTELRTFHSLQYFNLLKGIGTIDWYTTLKKIKSYATPKYFVDSQDKIFFNPEYKGEVYSLGEENIAILKELKPNTIVIEVNIKKPGKIIINQNYNKYWHAKKGKIEEFHGLLSLDLTEKGKYTILLGYIPKSFYLGLLISILSLAITLFYIKLSKKK